jgi:hypothetical protein
MPVNARTTEPGTDPPDYPPSKITGSGIARRSITTVEHIFVRISVLDSSPRAPFPDGPLVPARQLAKDSARLAPIG